MATKKKSGARKVKRAMHEMKRGKLKSGLSGKKVKSRKQANVFLMMRASSYSVRGRPALYEFSPSDPQGRSATLAGCGAIPKSPSYPMSSANTFSYSHAAAGTCAVHRRTRSRISVGGTLR
jgi:hypothetical protein